MFKLGFIILLCLIRSSLIFAQDSVLVIQKKIPLKVSLFTVNKIGELFIVDQENQLKKLDSNGDSVGVFNEVSKYGKLESVIADNPWRVLLFYHNYSTIVLLDKYLNTTSSLNLRKLNLLPSKTAIAYDNNIWIFDQQDYTLKKIDESGKILQQSTDLRLILSGNFSIQKMIDRNSFVFLYDPQLGLYQFDHYGTLKNKFAFLFWKDFEIVGDNILGFDDNYFYISKLRSVNFFKYPLPQQLKGFSSVVVTNNKYYFLVKGVINIFSLKSLQAVLQIK
ncbi:MAG: hypothetical protein NVS3B19_11800 [Ginsengibacter sp.]